MKVLNFNDFMKKYNLKDDTMNESQLQKGYNYPIHPRDSKLHSDRGFVNIDNGSQGGTHWTCFILKGKTSYYFDSFGGQPDNFLLNQFQNQKYIIIIKNKMKILNYVEAIAYTFSI